MYAHVYAMDKIVHIKVCITSKTLRKHGVYCHPD